MVRLKLQYALQGSDVRMHRNQEDDKGTRSVIPIYPLAAGTFSGLAKRFLHSPVFK